MREIACPLSQFREPQFGGRRFYDNYSMCRFVSVILITLAVIKCTQAQDEQVSRMQVIDRDLGVTCSHCHVGDDWKRDEKPQFAFAVRMIKMTQGLSVGTLRDLGGVTCWTCHRGKKEPERMPRASWEDRLAKWPEALKLKQEDAKKRAPEVYRNIQSLKDSPAGGIPMTMSIFAGALDVSCEYCHVPGHWDSDEKTAKNTARRMLRLFSEMPTYFEDNRQPGMQCYTCHQGSPKPQRQPTA
jgi:hypothetical protein